MQFDFSSYSHVGLRENNEDSFGTLPGEDAIAAVVADGVGGHAMGDVASKTAVAYILDSLKDQVPDEDLLLDAITGASLAIGREDFHGFTTVTALWLTSREAIAAHVGDSRIYQFRDGEILYQSQDHSDVMMAVLMGLSGGTFTLAAFVAGAFTNAIPGIVVHIVFIPVLVMALRKAGILRR